MLLKMRVSTLVLDNGAKAVRLASPEQLFLITCPNSRVARRACKWSKNTGPLVVLG